MNAQRIYDKDHHLLAVYVDRKCAAACDGVQFHTAPEDQLQLATMHRPTGYTVKPHKHEGGARTVYSTQEVLIVVRGKLQVSIYDRAGELWCVLHVGEGEAILLVDGGHAVRVLEEVLFYECKQGPYLGKDDKVALLFEGGPPQ